MVLFRFLITATHHLVHDTCSRAAVLQFSPPLIDGVSAKDNIELLNECFLFAADSFEGLCRPEKTKKEKKRTKVK